jgi:hypothetical protein
MAGRRPMIIILIRFARGALACGLLVTRWRSPRHPSSSWGSIRSVSPYLCPHSSPVPARGLQARAAVRRHANSSSAAARSHGSVGRRVAPTHAGNFFFFRIWCSLRRVARGGDHGHNRSQANQAAPTPTQDAIRMNGAQGIRRLRQWGGGGEPGRYTRRILKSEDMRI